MPLCFFLYFLCTAFSDYFIRNAQSNTFAECIHFHDCLSWVFFFLVCGIECSTHFKRFPIEQIEEHVHVCASYIIEFGDDTSPGDATTSDEYGLERASKICIHDNEQNDLTHSTLIKMA